MASLFIRFEISTIKRDRKAKDKYSLCRILLANISGSVMYITE